MRNWVNWIYLLDKQINFRGTKEYLIRIIWTWYQISRLDDQKYTASTCSMKCTFIHININLILYMIFHIIGYLIVHLLVHLLFILIVNSTVYWIIVHLLAHLIVHLNVNLVVIILITHLTLFSANPTTPTLSPGWFGLFWIWEKLEIRWPPPLGPNLGKILNWGKFVNVMPVKHF